MATRLAVGEDGDVEPDHCHFEVLLRDPIKHLLLGRTRPKGAVKLEDVVLALRTARQRHGLAVLAQPNAGLVDLFAQRAQPDANEHTAAAELLRRRRRNTLPLRGGVPVPGQRFRRGPAPTPRCGGRAAGAKAWARRLASGCKRVSGVDAQ